MRILALGSLPILQHSNHEVFRCDPTTFQILSTVNAKGIEVVCSEIELSATVTSRLRESRIPLIGRGVWASALEDPSYQIKLLHLLETVGLKVQNDHTQEQFKLVGWWNGLTSNFHYLSMNSNRLLDKERGPKVPSSWSVNFPLRLQSKAVRRTIEPLHPFLGRSGHVGPFSLGCILRDGEIVVVNVGAGFGGDADVAALEVVGDPFLYLLQNPMPLKYKQLDSFISLHLFSAEAPVSVSSDGARKHTFLSADQREAVVTSRGQDWREASRRVYRTVSRIQPDTIAYRSDLGLGFPELQKSLMCLSLL